MISEFQCPCHVNLNRNGWQPRKIFKAGGNSEGWWTYLDMGKKLEEDVIKLFESFHPGCEAVFRPDNSSNHNAFAHRVSSKSYDFELKPWALNPKYEFKDTGEFLVDGSIFKPSFFYYNTIVPRDWKGREKKTKVKYFKVNAQYTYRVNVHKSYLW